MNHDVHKLFRQKLDEIVENMWGHDFALKIWACKVNDDEHILDAIARHMCEALTDAEEE